MRRVPQQVLALLVPLLLVGGPTLADRLELLSGDVFSGRILRITDTEVSIQLHSGGIMTFRLSGTRSVRKISESGDESQVLYERSDRKTPVKSVPGRGPLPSGALPLPERLPGTTPDPSGTPAPDAPPSSRPAEDEISDSEYGFAVFPPRDFVAWREAGSENVRAYKDPITLTSFTVATYPSTEPLEKIVATAVRACSSQYSSFHVVKNKEMQVPGQGKGVTARLLEVEGRIGSIAIHQIQIFFTGDSGATVLTYSATRENYPRFAVLFEESVRSFRVKKKITTPEETGPQLPIGVQYPRVLKTGATPP